jgi:cell wall-associated NlpC family hydrolase/regulator of replication initiation timing
MTHKRGGTAVRLSLAVLVVVSTSLGITSVSSASPSKQEVEAAKAELDRLNEHVSLLVEQYNQAQLHLDEVQARLDEAKAAAQQAKADADRAMADLNSNAARAYQGFGSQIAVLFDATSLADFSDRLEFMGSIAQADTDLANEADLARQQAQWSAEEFQAAAAEQQTVLDDIGAKEQEIRNAAAEARSYYEDLNRQYQQHLAALEAAQEAAAQAAASSSVSVGSVPGPPPAQNPNAQAAIAAAYSVIGTPYAWGSADPNVGFDCSGLTMWSWAQAGVSLPHSSASQYAVLPHIDRSDLQPGDLIFFFSPISHVAMYLTPSTMIDANHPGDVVNVRPIYWEHFVGAARPV